MPLHPAWVKNISRRVLWAALEKDIDKKDRLAMAEFFGNCCCYCEQRLPARWHADHLIAFDDGGFNHLSNRVPSCPRCNEHEKRDMDWLEFLKIKTGQARDSCDFPPKQRPLPSPTSFSGVERFIAVGVAVLAFCSVRHAQEPGDDLILSERCASPRVTKGGTSITRLTRPLID